MLRSLLILLSALPAQAQNTIEVDIQHDAWVDDAHCSLREAVEAANTDQDFQGCVYRRDTSTTADRIDLPTGLYTVTQGGVGEDLNRQGDLDVDLSTGDLEIPAGYSPRPRSSTTPGPSAARTASARWRPAATTRSKTPTPVH